MADAHAKPPYVRKDLSYDVARHLLLQRFPVALKGLMEERHLSYRQLAYKTKLSAGYLNHLTKGTRPVPTDAVIRTIATALHVEPDFFLEYRLRQVVGFLEGSTQLIDALYGILLLRAPVSDEMKAILEKPGGGDHSGPQSSLGPDERG
jgi:transcriptional regulator with XRE-family HTH domain